MFNFFIFDLDDTLVATAELEKFRGRTNLNNETAAYRTALLTAVTGSGLQTTISEEFLTDLRASHPVAKFSVVTTAPRFYAATLLAYFYPSFSWDSVIGFEDVTQTKPDPEGLYEAFSRASCDNAWGKETIVLVGDSEKDIEAAYRAGIRVILFSACWPTKTRPSDFRAMNLLPDANVRLPQTLREGLDQVLTRLPAFELAVEGATFGTVRAPKIRHFCNHPGERTPEGKSPSISVVTLGRLFSEYDVVAERRDWHLPTQQIHAHKNSETFPESWIVAILSVIATVANSNAALVFGDLPVVVTCIPNKPNRTPRLERLLNQLAVAHNEDTLARGQFIFVPDILSYRAGARSHHGEYLTANQRVENTRDNLYVSQPTTIADHTFIVLDDVITTGASLFFADKYLRLAGAAEVICIALTQAIGKFR